MPIISPPGVGGPPDSGVDDLPGSVVVAAADALLGAPADAGPRLLPRILGEAPVAVLLIDRTSGQVSYANQAALDLAGQVTLPVATDRWAAAAGVTDIDGAPLSAASAPLSRVAAGDPVAGEPVRIRGTSQAQSSSGPGAELGTVVWVTGFPLGPAGDGDQMSLLVFLPVEHPHGAADGEGLLQALRNRAVLATDICFTISDPRRPGNPLVWVNPAFTKVTGYSLEDSIGRNCKFLQGPATDPAAVARIVTDLTAGRSSAVTLVNYRPDGTAFWNHVSISPVHDGSGDLVSFVGVQSDVTARMVADAERDAAHAAEMGARRAAELAHAGAEAARARLSLLAHSSVSLTDSLDPLELQDRLATLCVPLLADWVLIVQVDDAGVVTSVTSLHKDGETARPLLAEVESAFAWMPLPTDSPIALAIESGEPVAIGEMTADNWEAVTRGLDEPTVQEELGAGSMLAVPLTSRKGTWGSLLLVRARADAFTDDDLDVAQDLGRRAGQALDNARSYTRQASTAETLQRALLPAVPDLPHVEASARYTAATTTAAVGGDFYDLLRLPADAVGIVIGDVAGHDIAAAAAMGQLRSLIRSEAWDRDEPAPHVVLTRVDRLLGVLDLPIIATAALLRATRTTETSGAPGAPAWFVECANAGHPPVLFRTPEGEVSTLCEDHGVLLGTGMAGLLPDRTSTVCHLPAGTQLLLFTDGLVEQPDSARPGPLRDMDAGTARLHQLWASLPVGAPVDVVCSAVDALIDSRDDDIAVLALQLD